MATGMDEPNFAISRIRRLLELRVRGAKYAEGLWSSIWRSREAIHCRMAKHRAYGDGAKGSGFSGVPRKLLTR